MNEVAVATPGPNINTRAGLDRASSPKVKPAAAVQATHFFTEIIWLTLHIPGKF